MTTTSACGDGTATARRPDTAGCPLSIGRPPAEFDEWRAADGLQMVLWRHEPTWFISRYEDIRAALTDPRLSANTLPEALQARSADDNIPVIFARIDDPEHNRLRRMMTRDFTFRRAEAMRPQIQESGRRIPRRHDRGGAARRSRPRLRAAGAVVGDLPAARRPLREARVLSTQQHEGTRRPSRRTRRRPQRSERCSTTCGNWRHSRNANRVTT